MRQVLLIVLVLLFLPVLGSGQPNSEQTVRYRLTILRRAWSVDFTLPDYETVGDEAETDGYSFSASPRHNAKRGVFSVGVSMMQDLGCPDAFKHRDERRKELELNGIRRVPEGPGIQTRPQRDART